MVAEVNGSGASFTVGKVRQYFDPTAIAGFNLNVGNGTFRHISPDGRSILLSVSKGLQATAPLTLVTNWPTTVKK